MGVGRPHVCDAECRLVQASSPEGAAKTATKGTLERDHPTSLEARGALTVQLPASEPSELELM